MNTLKEKNKRRAQRKKRNRANIFGTSEKPRLSVFRSNKYISAQLINDEKGHTLAAAIAKQPEETGRALAEKALRSGIKKAVFNRGFYKYHGRVRALAEAVIKMGIKI